MVGHPSFSRGGTRAKSPFVLRSRAPGATDGALGARMSRMRRSGNPYGSRQTPMGLGIPVAPSGLDLEPEDHSSVRANRPSLPTEPISVSDPDVRLIARVPSARGELDFEPITFTRPQPSRRRSVLAKLLFATIVIAVLLLVATELS